MSRLAESVLCDEVTYFTCRSTTSGECQARQPENKGRMCLQQSQAVRSRPEQIVVEFQSTGVR